MVHGFLGGSAQWSGQIAAMPDQGDVITVDLPGFGQNAHLPAIDTITGFADWVVNNLNTRGVDRFNLLGHSMGGMVAQEITHRVPDRIEQLVLYATGSIGVLPGRFETIAESKMRAQHDGARATARRIAGTWFLNGADDPAYAGCAAIAEHASLDAILAGLDAMEAWSGENALPSIRSDTLVIWGDRDRTYQWPQIERLWTAIPQTSLSVFPSCAHAVHLEDPTGFNHVLRNYLR